MIDKKNPTFKGLMAACKCWGSTLKNAGVSLATKRNCKSQFQYLAQIQQEVGQVSYADMHTVGIPWGKYVPKYTVHVMHQYHLLT